MNSMDNKNEFQEPEYVERSARLNEFLWVCAGANRKVLRQCPTEYAKYAGIGGTILFTALMAMLSGGYAMNFVFNNPMMAVAFGIFWGLLIFNLDRFIVNTMYSDGKVTISWNEFKSGLPRIIMAIFLGIVISTPLEMKIFEDRINSQIVKDNARRTAETREVANLDYEKLQSLKDEQTKLFNEREALAKTLQRANEDLKDEVEGKANSGKVGKGQIYEQKLDYKNSCEQALNTWDAKNESRLNRLENEISAAQAKINSFENDIESGMEENGFCVRYEAFANVKAENPHLAIVSIIIMLLFIIIETAPTFFKMMIASGPYDDYLRAEAHKIHILSEKRISDVNDQVNTSVMISTEQNRNRLEAEAQANKALLEKIAIAQSEVLSEAIELWKQGELQKVRENPTTYINSTTSTDIISSKEE